MKKEKILKKFAYIMPFILVVMLSGCGADEPVSADLSGIEDSKNDNQNVDPSSEDSVISSGEASDELIERVDNPDGEWTISEYSETGEKVRESVYDKDGKQIQNMVYSTDGSIKNTTEYEYNETGEQVKYVTYEYNAAGDLMNMTEYDGNEKQNKTENYAYNIHGNLVRVIERDKSAGEEDETVIICIDYSYDNDGNLSNASESVNGKKMRLIKYKRDGSVAYYDADFETDGERHRYETYRADGRLYSESELTLEESIVKYISYYYDGNGAEIAGYTVDEYDAFGNIVDTSYFGLDANSEFLNPTLVQQKETDHFIFYCTDWDVEVLDDLEEVLEGCYSKITSDLEKAPSDKTKVYISEH